MQASLLIVIAPSIVHHVIIMRYKMHSVMTFSFFKAQTLRSWYICFFIKAQTLWSWYIPINYIPINPLSTSKLANCLQKFIAPSIVHLVIIMRYKMHSVMTFSFFNALRHKLGTFPLNTFPLIHFPSPMQTSLLIVHRNSLHLALFTTLAISLVDTSVCNSVTAMLNTVVRLLGCTGNCSIKLLPDFTE